MAVAGLDWDDNPYSGFIYLKVYFPHRQIQNIRALLFLFLII
jgi:hypothetical protein